ncbi:N-acetylmuramoyl-L-alanine amidase [Snodgrassella communis]|uniref:N-acetylmuramoyl-L-alanine amidase n=1 Tax=Snodgrassella communis TaxID=2946699 RepID=UPI000C1DFBA5|nr:N-acetylmuramoyl-L-alanine amidase [Snodgrassella communis]PIT10257.1 N-acetylmuramoyl-L-alanine amidase [Snodgrassella communis]PIT25501.1 N-acetylmuramoyl-L-alanine amidase [Snodgrassella communis]PIT27100.1 N-acetylmuramoyl-L-alanine amidase [Snodgrassella communis]
MSIITITAGHSNTDPGAINAKSQITEASITCEMRNMVAHYLDKARVHYRTDGTGTTNQPLNNAIKLISGSKVAVEFHCNASSSASSRGVEALAQPKDRALCQRLCKAVADVTGSSLRGDKGYQPENAGQHTRLGYVRAGGIILELFFISNDAELAVWNAKKWLIAKAVAEVLIAEADA